MERFDGTTLAQSPTSSCTAGLRRDPGSLIVKHSLPPARTMPTSNLMVPGEQQKQQ